MCFSNVKCGVCVCVCGAVGDDVSGRVEQTEDPGRGEGRREGGGGGGGEGGGEEEEE